MIRPSAQQVLATIQTAFAEQIVPVLTDTESRSAAATIEHLLRHVVLRLEHEQEALTEERDATQVLNGRLEQWLVDHGLEVPSRRVGATDCGTVASLAAEVEASTEHLCAMQRTLQEARDRFGEEADYRALRQAIRDHAAEVIRRDGRMIEPAFSGKGPRR